MTSRSVFFGCVSLSRVAMPAQAGEADAEKKK
jgi:hypothetical protein